MRSQAHGLASRLDSRARRRSSIIGLAGLLVVVTGGAGAWICVVLASRAHSFSDRLAEASVITAGGTLLLALIAAVVAVMAYAAATGLPDLRLQVRFPFSKANRPSFDVTEEYQLVSARDFMQTTATVQLRNDSGFSARNPAVIVRLDNAYSDGDPAKIRNARLGHRRVRQHSRHYSRPVGWRPHLLGTRQLGEATAVPCTTEIQSPSFTGSAAAHVRITCRWLPARSSHAGRSSCGRQIAIPPAGRRGPWVAVASPGPVRAQSCREHRGGSPRAGRGRQSYEPDASGGHRADFGAPGKARALPAVAPRGATPH
jgi:hypothetical protein